MSEKKYMVSIDATSHEELAQKVSEYLALNPAFDFHGEPKLVHIGSKSIRNDSYTQNTLRWVQFLKRKYG